jgi:hypothetical protein
VLDSIGNFEYVVGTCLEGSEKFGIKNREWLVNEGTGGMSIDLGDHVFSFVTLLRDRMGDVTLEGTRAGASIEALGCYEKVMGTKAMAETYLEVSMTGGNGGFPMRFALGKYTGVDDWRFHVQGEHGYVHVNLASNSRKMSVVSPVFTGEVVIDSERRYSIVMKDLVRRVGDSSLQHPYGFENARDTLSLVLDIRDKFQRPYFEYETGRIPGMEDVTDMYRHAI